MIAWYTVLTYYKKGKQIVTYMFVTFDLVVNDLEIIISSAHFVTYVFYSHINIILLAFPWSIGHPFCTLTYFFTIYLTAT